jgi:hypothetical protein
MVYAGIMTRNEARGYEDMNPIDGLDEILQPVNMQTSKQINENQNENPNHKSVK